jgi:hypothetical protein
MSSVSATTVVASTEALNQVLQSAQTKTIEQAEKLMRLSVETVVGKEAGKGSIVNCCA